MVIERIRWMGHASFLIKGEPLIYIDPWKLGGEEEAADLILISHAHHDHFSAGDVARIRAEETDIVCPKDVASKLKGRVTAVAPGSRLTVRGVDIEVLPAYNLKASFHPRSDVMLGFVLTLGGERLYYAGDTDFTPEMSALSGIDVALLPVGGRYTMDAEQAAEAANAFMPRIAAPYHFGDIIGSKADAERFAKLFKGETRILSNEPRP